jgi:hypothetical protein
MQTITIALGIAVALLFLILVKRSMDTAHAMDLFASESFLGPGSRPPGSQCRGDLECQFGCCENGRCAERCKCGSNQYWNTNDGPNKCTDVFNPNANPVKVDIGRIFVPGVGWVNGGTQVEATARNLPPGSLCMTDTACALGCCQSHPDGKMRCAQRCACSNRFWNEKNGCPDTRAQALAKIQKVLAAIPRPTLEYKQQPIIEYDHLGNPVRTWG